MNPPVLLLRNRSLPAPCFAQTAAGDAFPRTGAVPSHERRGGARGAQSHAACLLATATRQP
eukprot:814063-Prymnesium_polylepis.1